MQTEPISVKEALARFKRTRPAVEPPPLQQPQQAHLNNHQHYPHVNLHPVQLHNHLFRLLDNPQAALQSNRHRNLHENQQVSHR